MNWLDYAVIAVLGLSVLLGWWRGLVYEVLSLAGWVVAFVVSRLFAEKFAPLLPLSQPQLNLVLAYALLFMLALIASGVVAWLLSRLVKWAGLGWLDGSLGAVFGTLRGVLVLMVLVLLAGMTQVPQQAFWKQAALHGALERLAEGSKTWLPESLAQKIHYRN